MSEAIALIAYFIGTLAGVAFLFFGWPFDKTVVTMLMCALVLLSGLRE